MDAHDRFERDADARLLEWTERRFRERGRLRAIAGWLGLWYAMDHPEVLVGRDEAL